MSFEQDHIVFCCVWETGAASRATLSQGRQSGIFMTTRSTEYRKIKQKRHDELQQQKLSVYLST